MAETSKQQSSSPPEELHWGIAYLREDIQDLRQDLRHEIGGVNTRADENNNKLNARIDETNRSLRESIDETSRSLGERIDETNRYLGERINENTRFLIERIDERTRSLNARIDSRFALLVTIMVALTSVIVAAIKL